MKCHLENKMLPFRITNCCCPHNFFRPHAVATQKMLKCWKVQMSFQPSHGTLISPDANRSLKTALNVKTCYLARFCT